MPTDVFSVLTDRLIARSADVGTIVQTGNSFEEWLTWEFILACKSRGWKTLARPQYAKCGVPSNEYADAFVEAPGTHFLVEFGVIHWDTSRQRWVPKLRYDREKLLRVRRDGLAGLQVILALDFWNDPTGLVQTVPTIAPGEVLVKAWPIRGV